ncbi:hypothetical protein LRS06_20165 [Hymenobacter sp. J193]|uniref:hypothetical protein n=1 Tax=Hymenobacter sp. J193 TaxID=2898429 RepID=UPI002151987F|nr:hypothetical protein [Hymenobacter sp. J193]MCR5890046.1 hypothetical protein [Hymenobacter sp. J193]
MLPLRAIPGQLTFLGIQPGNPLPTGGIGPGQLLDEYADALSRLPWLREWPALLKGGVPTPATDGWVLRFPLNSTSTETQADSTSSEENLTDFPLLCDDLSGWELRAISGGSR